MCLDAVMHSRWICFQHNWLLARSRRSTRTGSELMGWSSPWQATMGPWGPPAASALQVESDLTTNAGSGTIVVRFSCLQHDQPSVECEVYSTAVAVVPKLHINGIRNMPRVRAGVLGPAVHRNTCDDAQRLTVVAGHLMALAPPDSAGSSRPYRILPSRLIARSCVTKGNASCKLFKSDPHH